MHLLQSSTRPLTPLEIYSILRQSGQTLGMVSVYRALELLTELCLVCLVYTPDGTPGYVLGMGGHHHHIVCQKCHQSIAFAGSEDLTALIQRVEAETRYQVKDHLLQLYGICPACREGLTANQEVI